VAENDVSDKHYNNNNIREKEYMFTKIIVPGPDSRFDPLIDVSSHITSKHSHRDIRRDKKADCGSEKVGEKKLVTRF
jgi:hypothetical protein